MAPKKIQDIYPLSPMQQGMLFHSLLEPNSGAYIIQTSFELHGYLDTDAFAAAWQKIIEQHSILRTAFVWNNLEQPLQVVGSTAKISLTEQDWQGISSIEQQSKLGELLRQRKQEGFNLNKAPLMRFDLIKMRSQVSQFIWTYHHLLLDGWSVPLIFKELLGYYQCLSQGLAIPQTTPSPYKNYIAWLQQQDSEAGRNFWHQELKGFTNPTSIADIRQRERAREAEEQRTNYLQQELKLAAETTFKIEFLAREYQLTPNTLIQAAWALLLHRYSGDRDLVFGATSSGRPPALPQAQTMVGLFINTLPVRVQIDPQQSLIEWLKELQAKQLARQEYEYTSLLDIHRVRELPRDTPLFQSIVVLENYPVESSLKQSLAGLDIRNVKNSEQTNYPLTLYAALDLQLSLKLLYRDRLFDDRTINTILEHLKTLLESITSNPEQKVGEVKMLTALEREQLLALNNSTARDFPSSCFHQLFEARVAEISGEKEAVVTDDEALTYSELNARANQLAHYLRSQGLENNDLVGIYLTRDCNLLVALLAVLKAGAAYVPLDPSYPQERINYIINHAGIEHLITQQELESGAIKSDRPLKIINLTADQSKIQQQEASNLNLAVNHQDLAYVIYTSGSTGKPKGVAIKHRSLVNFLYSMKEQPGITESDRLLAVTTVSFDIAALELYLPLLVGATVVIASKDLRERTLAERIEQEQITLMQATPITWKMLLADNWTGNQNLKILCGGEALDPKLAQQLVAKGKEVWNMYGPTETTIWSAAYQLPQEQNIDQVYLGKAIANTQLYILDSQLNLVPPGIPGELYIGGEGLAQGYFNQPDLTGKSFIPNPFLSVETEENSIFSLLYKTGDRVRLLPDSNLEYLGRIDNQIKLGGFRIELGEIEAALTQHPEISTAVVLSQSDRLIAYITRSSSSPDSVASTSEKIRQFLANKLPSYMLPSSYVVLNKLPVTPNGKIDRIALSRMNPVSQKPQKEVVGGIQRGSGVQKYQQAIAEIWQDILQVEPVNLKDNFFDLGGQSLLMIRAHSQLKEKLALEISLVDLFRYPTVESLAEYFAANQINDHGSSASIINHQLEEQQNREQIMAGVNRQKELRKRRQRA
ncbi:MAG: amino acid adenylation domain-containing protein [Cyanobacteria bacterium J06621_8]